MAIMGKEGGNIQIILKFVKSVLFNFCELSFQDA